MNKSKLLVLLGVLACLGMSAYRLHKFFYNMLPVADPGECILMTEGKDRLKVLVLENNEQEKSSLVLMMIRNDFTVPTVFTYAEMRDFNAEKIECEEEDEKGN